MQPMISGITAAAAGASASGVGLTDRATSAVAVSGMVSHKFTISVDFLILVTDTL